MAMKVHGQCHCGEISYTADVEPGTVAVCHCTDCQTFSGAPYRAMIRPDPDTFALTGNPRHYAKTAYTGKQRLQGFCGTCGTALFAIDPDGTRLGLRLGAIAERRELGAPVRQIWCDSALDWADDLTAIPETATQ
jgi:hypothetical protein